MIIADAEPDGVTPSPRMYHQTFWRRPICLFFGWVLLAALPDSRANELALDIVATTTQPQEEKPTLFISNVFYVVLTNTSKKPVRIFEDWCESALSFEVEGAHGKVYHLERKLSDELGRTFLATFKMPPGGHYVFAVDFDNDHWPMLEDLRKDPQLSKRPYLKAVFTETNFGAPFNVWQGKVKSIARRFSIF